MTETAHKFELEEDELASLFAMLTLGVQSAPEEVMAPSVFLLANRIGRQVGLHPEDEGGKDKLRTTDAGQQATFLMMAALGKMRENGGEEATDDIPAYMKTIGKREVERLQTT